MIAAVHVHAAKSAFREAPSWWSLDSDGIECRRTRPVCPQAQTALGCARYRPHWPGCFSLFRKIDLLPGLFATVGVLVGVVLP